MKTSRMNDENDDGLGNLRNSHWAARRLIYVWIASSRPASLKAGTRERATSNPALRFPRLAVRSVALSASPFCLGKPVEVSESGTREFFSLALTGFQPPLQMAFQEASSAVRNVD